MAKKIFIAILVSLFAISIHATVSVAVETPPLTKISIYIYREGIYPRDRIMAQITETGVTPTRTVRANGSYMNLDMEYPLPYAGASPLSGYRLVYDTNYRVSKHKGVVVTVTASGFNEKTMTTITESKSYTIPRY